MISVEVTKKITSSKLFTTRQIVFGIIAVAVGIGTFFLLSDKVNFELLMWIMFIEMFVIIGFGVIRISDMNLFVFMLKLLKGVDKRPYSNNKGVFNDDEFNIF